MRYACQCLHHLCNILNLPAFVDRIKRSCRIRHEQSALCQQSGRAYVASVWLLFRQAGNWTSVTGRVKGPDRFEPWFSSVVMCSSIIVSEQEITSRLKATVASQVADSAGLNSRKITSCRSSAFLSALIRHPTGAFSTNYNFPARWIRLCWASSHPMGFCCNTVLESAMLAPAELHQRRLAYRYNSINLGDKKADHVVRVRDWHFNSRRPPVP